MYSANGALLDAEPEAQPHLPNRAFLIFIIIIEDDGVSATQLISRKSKSNDFYYSTPDQGIFSHPDLRKFPDLPTLVPAPLLVPPDLS